MLVNKQFWSTILALHNFIKTSLLHERITIFNKSIQQNYSSTLFKFNCIHWHYTFLEFFCFSSKNFLIISISFFDKVSNLRCGILTDQTPELVIRNCQCNYVYVYCLWDRVTKSEITQTQWLWNNPSGHRT